MQPSLINPKEYIKNTESHEDYICNICYQICVRPARCAGPCKKIFCLKCVSETRMSSGLKDSNTKDQCPMRCSSPFLTDVLPELNIEFECPYNGKQCQVPIFSLQQFNDHYKKCKYVPEKQIYFKKMQNQFRCLKGHQLQFFVGTFHQMCNSFCSICNENKLCRAICRQCDNCLCCVDCRTPPCEKGKCPIGHQMKLWKASNLSYICDICGISTAVSNSNVYDDTECNFGICEQCFKKIKNKVVQNSPKIKLQTNKHDECEKGHKLTIYQGANILTLCSKCSKQRQCIKECKECEKRYCLACKVAFIQGGEQKCLLNHKFIPITTQTLGADQEFNFSCMKCSNQSNVIYHDKICRIRLCVQCFEYSITLDVQKNRLIEDLTCKKNHILNYVTNPDFDKGYCTLCKRKTIAKLYCTYCQKLQRGYCCICKPLSKFQTCYYGHKLLECQNQENNLCCLCEKNQKNLIGCKKCMFFMCKSCEHQFSHNHSFYDQQSQMIDQSQESSQY